MIVLKAIGTFFAKIGRWIKETAWVQPLLIVGGIFAIIFSIPYISSWVGSWFATGNKIDAYFESHRISLQGAQDKNSDADKLMEYMLNYDENTTSAADKEKYGTKFFIMFTKEGCEGCENVYNGFQTLEDNWNKSSEFTVADGQGFKLYSIFIDETNDNNDKLFQTFFYETNYLNYFEEVSSEMANSSYYVNQGGASSSYASNLEMLAGANDEFTVPTIFYVDFEYNVSSECKTTNQLGVTEVLFSVEEKTSGTANIGRARTLFDCYNHTGVFSDEDSGN